MYSNIALKLYTTQRRILMRNLNFYTWLAYDRGERALARTRWHAKLITFVYYGRTFLHTCTRIHNDGDLTELLLLYYSIICWKLQCEYVSKIYLTMCLVWSKHQYARDAVTNKQHVVYVCVCLNWFIYNINNKLTFKL